MNGIQEVSSWVAGGHSTITGLADSNNGVQREICYQISSGIFRNGDAADRYHSDGHFRRSEHPLSCFGKNHPAVAATNTSQL